MAKYGLIGKDIGYSFSKTFFTAKFEHEKRTDSYVNFDVGSISNLCDIITKNEDLKGLNVTIPYKEAVIPLLDRIDKEAKKIGAVNTIKINRDGKLIGYNTDNYGFAKALADFLPIKEKTALILGTGGASKAIAYVLETMGFTYRFVSRKKTNENLTYSNLDRNVMVSHYLIINCTPLGTFPNTHELPNIPYQYLTKDHVLFDLIYNPRETEFLKMGYAKGARVTNGFKMLEHQAKKSWSIWKS
ncbi:shikimate dehydrogenase family protein [Ulvibacter litoralis]|uniref:Shikimate dehydrogenase n=1 Tax=Ulvibacter litoralis TaxID=227084 RepID=A0A1G7EPY6_9FLAO|nr:shikimate dehydrogenase [Ulvibacter litoralis]GHC54299.1 shikimate 5-dehydrogenase [Ulvibacter litoralis]SDE65738.1 shikimate dehydrogenase [Ulvibacter litoralis]